MINFEKITFGKYEWIVLERKKDKILILTESIIGQRDFNDKKEEVTWEDSEVRHYLNTDFYNSFDLRDKEKIIPTVSVNEPNNWYGTMNGRDTTDMIFLLSLQEVAKYYFGDSGNLLENPKPNQRYWFERKDPNNQNRISLYLDRLWWWWTRTPGKNNNVAVYIHGDGNIGIQGNGVSKTTFNTLHPITGNNKGGLRVALWLKI